MPAVGGDQADLIWKASASTTRLPDLLDELPYSDPRLGPDGVLHPDQLACRGQREAVAHLNLGDRLGYLVEQQAGELFVR